MKSSECIFRLMECFPNSSVNSRGEFIAHREANEYFQIQECKDDFEIKCKVLEWLSRGAYKTEPFEKESKNDKFHQFMQNGINQFLDTSFTESEFDAIYTYLGNCCNRAKTVRFIESGYDIGILSEKQEETP